MGNKLELPGKGNMAASKKEREAVEREKFQEYIDEIESQAYAEEYNSITLGERFPCTAARLPGNEDKNRYPKCVPYDKNRVVLKTKDENQNEANYINGNHVAGYLPESKFIATQGPKENTAEDFWVMVWEYGVQQIMMFAKVMEHGKEKCFKYWPDEYNEVTYGDIKITAEAEERGSYFEVHHFTVTKAGSDETRTITHYYYLDWPDFGVPARVEDIVHLVDRMFSEKQDGEVPVLFHCSAGIGRTGTVLTTICCVQQIHNDGKLDVRARVDTLRNYRMNLVETVAQYRYVHKAVARALQDPDVQLDNWK